MASDFHVPFNINDLVSIPQFNSRAADLDEAIGDVIASAGGVAAAVLYDEKAAGTDGGDSTATTTHIRDLNAKADPDLIVSLDSNQFTPIAGTYFIWVIAPCYGGGLNKLILHNATTMSDVAPGLPNNAGALDPTGLPSLMWVFTANGSTAYEIHHYVTTANSGDGLGRAVDDGVDPETYTLVFLMKFG